MCEMFNVFGSTICIYMYQYIYLFFEDQDVLAHVSAIRSTVSNWFSMLALHSSTRSHFYGMHRWSLISFIFYIEKKVFF